MERECSFEIDVMEVEGQDTDLIELNQGRVPLCSSGMEVIKFGIEKR